MVKTARNGVVEADAVGYAVPETPSARRFLDENPYLVPLLDEAKARILDYFPDPEITLSVESDNEVNIQGEQLAMLIGTTLSPEDALEKLKRLDKDWWLDKVAQARGKLVINVEFR